MAAKNASTVALRLLACSATLSAALAIGTSRETANFSTFSIKIEYSDSTSYWCFLVVNIISCAYSFGVLLLPSNSLLLRTVVAVDAVLTVLLASSSSAALAVICVEKNGNDHAGWGPICGLVPIYCNHVIGAVAASFFGVVMFMMLLLLSISHLIDPLLVQDP